MASSFPLFEFQNSNNLGKRLDSTKSCAIETSKFLLAETDARLQNLELTNSRWSAPQHVKANDSDDSKFKVPRTIVKKQELLCGQASLSGRYLGIILNRQQKFMATPQFGNVEDSCSSSNLNGKKYIRGPYKLKKHQLNYNSSQASS